jgi:hypothetical protein
MSLNADQDVVVVAKDSDQSTILMYPWYLAIFSALTAVILLPHAELCL